MLAHSSSKLLVTRTGIKARTSSIWASGFNGLFIYFFFFEMRFDLGTLDSGCPLGYLFIHPTGRKRVCEIRFVSSGENWENPCLVCKKQFSLWSHVPVECMVSTLLRPHSIVRYFNRVWITRSAVFTRLWCFRMLNVDKMKHWNSSRVQKNEIVFKINGKHH